MTSERARSLSGALAMVVLTGAACGHRAPPPTAAPKPIAAAVLPPVVLEAKTEFQTAMRVLKQGRRSQPEARAHLRRATELDPKFFEAWHDLGWLDVAVDALCAETGYWGRRRATSSDRR